MACHTQASSKCSLITDGRAGWQGWCGPADGKPPVTRGTRNVEAMQTIQQLLNYYKRMYLKKIFKNNGTIKYNIQKLSLIFNSENKIFSFIGLHDKNHSTPDLKNSAS